MKSLFGNDGMADKGGANRPSITQKEKIMNKIEFKNEAVLDAFLLEAADAELTRNEGEDQYMEEHNGELPNWDDIIIYCDGYKSGWYWVGDAEADFNHGRSAIKYNLKDIISPNDEDLIRIDNEITEATEEIRKQTTRR